jgi:hypothetical protein
MKGRKFSKVCFEKFGITADAVVSAAKKVLGH